MVCFQPGWLYCRPSFAKHITPAKTNPLASLSCFSLTLIPYFYCLSQTSYKFTNRNCSNSSSYLKVGFSLCAHSTVFHLVEVLRCFQRLRNYWFIQYVLTSSVNWEYSSVGCIKLGCTRTEVSFILLMKCPYHTTKTNTQQFIHVVPCSLNLKIR